MKSVTYRGATDPRDPTTRYKAGEKGEFVLPKDAPAPVPVPDEIAKQLAETEGHTFEIADAPDAKATETPAPAEREVSVEAKKLASRHGIDLASIEGDGPIGPDDVRAAIAAAQK